MLNICCFLYCVSFDVNGGTDDDCDDEKAELSMNMMLGVWEKSFPLSARHIFPPLAASVPPQATQPIQAMPCMLSTTGETLERTLNRKLLEKTQERTLQATQPMQAMPCMLSTTGETLLLCHWLSYKL